MQKYYGTCKILGDPDFTYYIEYKPVFVNDKYGEHTIMVGRDVVTNTRLTTMTPQTETNSLRRAALNDIVKKRKLIIESYKEISREKMIEFLNNITDQEIESYLMHINEIKSKYAQEILRCKMEIKESRQSIRNLKNSINRGLSRVRSLTKR